MSTGQDDPVIAEKQVAASEDGGSASDLSLNNGVARDYELKCALSKSLVRAILTIHVSSLHTVNKCMQEECVPFSATGDDVLTLLPESDSVVINGSSLSLVA